MQSDNAMKTLLNIRAVYVPAADNAGISKPLSTGELSRFLSVPLALIILSVKWPCPRPQSHAAKLTAVYTPEVTGDL